MARDVEGFIAAFEAKLHGAPDYPAKLLGLAEAVAGMDAPLRAMQLARKALAAAPEDAELRMRARHMLSSLLPGYHAAMMNDTRRNAAWDAALRSAIRPGMLVLEIGTGAGMLALMAARAGAQVVTCETSAVAAEFAREIATANGLADRISVITAHSRHLQVGEHLPRKADMLVCDIFADTLLGFDPLPAIADARARLLAPGAPCMPRAASLHAALASWSDYDRCGAVESAAGFDLTPFADVIPTYQRRVGTSELALLTGAAQLFRFDFAQETFPPKDRSEARVEALADGEAHCIARWIRLELDDERVLEARPEAGARSFNGLTLAPLDEPVRLGVGEVARIGAAYEGRRVITWLD